MVLVALLLAPIEAEATERRIIDRAPFADEIGEREVAFLARDLETGTTFVLEGSDVETRRAPWSTFKIPNLLIALETGVAGSLSDRRVRDPRRRPAAGFWPKAWHRDHTLASAFRHSVVWYFRDIAADVGTARYRSMLQRWHYGNADVDDGSDRFWLGGSLRISPAEQVAFLTKLLRGQLGVSSTSIEALASASQAARHRNTGLHGKSGSGPLVRGRFDGAFEGWYVGWVARHDRQPAIFALYVRAPTFSALRTFRKDFAVRLLLRVGLLLS